MVGRVMVVQWVVGGGESDGGADVSHPLDFVVSRHRRSISVAQAVLPRIQIEIPSQQQSTQIATLQAEVQSFQSEIVQARA